MRIKKWEDRPHTDSPAGVPQAMRGPVSLPELLRRHRSTYQREEPWRDESVQQGLMGKAAHSVWGFLLPGTVHVHYNRNSLNCSLPVPGGHFPGQALQGTQSLHPTPGNHCPPLLPRKNRRRAVALTTHAKATPQAAADTSLWSMRHDRHWHTKLWVPRL